MKTVFQALQEAKGTVVPRIGPVKISAKYPAKSTANGKLMRNIQISDDSGKAQVTIWGDAANNVPDGQTVQLTSSLKVDEYNGQKKFTANEFTWNGSDSPAPTGSGAPVQTQRVANMDAHEMAITMAKFTNAYYQALMDEGLDKDFVEKSAALAPQFAAQWFFGDKSPSFPEAPEEDPY